MTTTARASGPRTVHAPRGTTLSCKGWQQEAALRMLMNNLDPDVAEDPDHLIVYGGTGRAARSWEAFDAIVRELRRLENDETLLVQSGKPVGVFRTTPDAPRVLIANALLVPHWATWETFRELERAGLTMYGQMTAGSWIYIATQGIIQGTYETFAEAARQHFSGTLAGTATLTAGLGGMGGAQPLAVTMNEGSVLAIEVDPARAERRHRSGYVDEVTTDLDEAVARVDSWRTAREARSIALVANAADVEPELVRRGWKPDLVTDQTSAHDPLNGYVPGGMPFVAAVALRESDPNAYLAKSMASIADHVRAMLAFQARRCRDIRLRQQHPRTGEGGGRGERVRLPRVRARLHPAALQRGEGPVPLGGTVRRAAGHPEDRCGADGALPPGFQPAPMAAPGRGEGSVPGPARTDLLARLRRTREGRAADQRDGRAPGSWPRPSSSAATTSTRVRSPAPSVRRRGCATARTPSRTGPSSTR